VLFAGKPKFSIINSRAAYLIQAASSDYSPLRPESFRRRFAGKKKKMSDALRFLSGLSGKTHHKFNK
jgi:hypothetical protein